MTKERILTNAEMVEEFGNDKQKEHFAKYGKFKSKDIKNAILITAKQKYEVVEDLGRKGFRVEKERKEMLDRKEFQNYGNCGQGQITYGQELNNLVLDFILKNCKNNLKNLSLNQWLVEIGLIPKRFGIASWSEKARENHIEALQEIHNKNTESVDGITQKDIEVLEQFVQIELSRLKRHLSSVFHKLSTAKIIIYKKTLFGCLVEDGDHRELSDREISAVGDLKRELSLKYNIGLDEVSWKTKDKNVVAYKDELKEKMQEMGFHYVYETHGCVVQVTDSKIERYIEKLNKKGELQFVQKLQEDTLLEIMSSFRRLYGDNSMRLAREREENKTGSQHIKQLKMLKQYTPLWEKFLNFYDLNMD